MKPQDLTWGTLSEKGWLREMVKKRVGAERLQFLQSYKSGIPLRSDWGSICQDTIRKYTDRLIQDCKMQGGISDNTRL